MREFFFRVAALTFEARVLAELERNNNKQVDGIVRKCLRLLDGFWACKRPKMHLI